MNALTIGEARNGAVVREPADEKMDQVRDLLFGEFQRQNDLRMAALEARIREFETDVQRRLDAILARLDAYAAEGQAERRGAFDDLARSVEELGQRIRQISRE